MKFSDFKMIYANIYNHQNLDFKRNFIKKNPFWSFVPTVNGKTFRGLKVSIKLVVAQWPNESKNMHKTWSIENTIFNISFYRRKNEIKN